MKLLNAFTFYFLLFTFNLFGQFGGPKDLLKVQSFLSFDSVYPASEVKLALKMKVKDSWHINSSKPNEDYLIASELKVNSPFKLKSVKFPEAENLKFEFSDVPVSVYQGEITVGAIVVVPDSIKPGDNQLIVTFSYQACNDVSCLAPNEFVDTLNIHIVDHSQTIKEINGEIFSGLNLSYSSAEVSEESGIADTLANNGLFFSLLFVFLGGLALNLTPCVYPLIPITIGYFGGQSEGSTKRLFLLGVLYVLGIALTYSIVGVVTSLTGSIFGVLLQNPIVTIFIVLVFVTLSLSQFGVYEFKLPDSLVIKAGGAKSGAYGAFFMGLTMGIVAAPCIGPFVIGLVTYVAAKGDPLYGFWMFFSLAVGLGTPYIFLAIFSGKIKSLPKAGDWMDGVKHIFGWLLLAAAIYFVGPLIPKSVNDYLLPVFTIVASLYLLLVDKVANNVKGFFRFKVIFSVIIFSVAVWMIIPGNAGEPDWVKYSDEKFESSISGGHKAILDFYADWCIPCKELDKITFADVRVINKLKDFDAFKVDLTKTMSDETEKIRNKFNILGMPTIILYGSSGKEVKRITGFINPDEFLKLIKQIN